MSNKLFLLLLLSIAVIDAGCTYLFIDPPFSKTNYAIIGLVYLAFLPSIVMIVRKNWTKND